jgi:hypothetical protein
MKSKTIALTVALGALVVHLAACSAKTDSSFTGGGRRSKTGAPPSDSDAAADEADEKAVGSTKGSVSKETLAAQINGIGRASGPDEEAVFASIAHTPLAEYFNTIVSNATNEPLEVDGHLLVNARDFLVAHEDLLDDLASRYATMGEYAASVDVHSAADITHEQIERGLEIAEKVLSDGDLAAFVGEDFEGSAAAEGLMLTSAKGFYLNEAAACAASVVGAAVGAVGVGLCPAAATVTAGFACVGAVAGLGMGVNGAVAHCGKHRGDKSVDQQNGGGDGGQEPSSGG